MTDIVIPPTIALMPPAPQLTDTQADFNTKAFATVGAYPTFIAQTNAAAAAARQNAVAAEERATGAQSSAAAAVTARDVALAARDQAAAAATSAANAPGTSGSSVSTVAMGLGTKSLTTQTGKAWTAGQSIVVALSGDPVGRRMLGVIASYDINTGAMSFIVGAGGVVGSGTYAGWLISLTAARDNLVLMGQGPGQGAQVLSIGWGAGAEGIVRPLVSVDGGHWGGLAGDWEVQEAAPPGKRGEFYMNAPPAGWLKANGAAVSRTTYVRLFQRIGTLYGAGDGVTTFNLPNDYGLFARSWDESGAVDPGRAFASVQASANLIHAHGGSTVSAGGHTPTGSANSGGGYTPTGSVGNGGGHTNTAPQTRVAGGGGAAASFKSEDTAGVAMTTNTVPNHDHPLTMNAVPPHVHGVTMDAVPPHAHVIGAEGASESRPANRAVMVCIKY
ncbi:phage tail protein [Pseudorhodoferax sp. Leaf274]|uniref:phage tail protein n=1 Tax=Pseudorhodoferax sp. Leaf274 TaxID=1736318 RepID=UPI000702A700|nr:phage tail protein [Pseudorhodoferax sp. Leaf274]KQP39682.1 hypothetical protein ASF44_08090 [Pseudorhodoferax sp. Leaf274]